MLKQLLTFNYENRWLFALKFALVTAPLQLLMIPIFKMLFDSDNDGYIYGSNYFTFVIWIVNTPVMVLLALLLNRYQSKLNFVWRDYIVRGILVAIPVSVINGFIEMPFEASYLGQNHPEYNWFSDFNWVPHLIVTLTLGTLTAIFTGIYLDRTSGAIKFKRTMSVILFVWFLFNLVTGGDSEPEEAPDHVALDTDGDGIKDTIAMDTNKDGLIDSVASDTTGDGKIDTVILDSNHDGRADVTLRDRDGDGRPDGIA